jgi:hypothetical protein
MSRALSDVRGAMDNVADLSDDAKPPLIQEVKYA